jgi:hypothetical protein
MNLSLLSLSFLYILLQSALAKPNFVIILTDDQDSLLNSLEPLKKIEKYLTNSGVSFSNAVSSWSSHIHDVLINVLFSAVYILTHLLPESSEYFDGLLCAQHGHFQQLARRRLLFGAVD